MYKRIGIFLGFSLLAAVTLTGADQRQPSWDMSATRRGGGSGVSITLTNTGTNTTRTTLSTNDAGLYFPNVPPGVYTVAATHPGFKVESAKDGATAGAAVLDPELHAPGR